MSTNAKLGMICGAAAMLLTAAISASPVRAQLAPPPPAPPVSPAAGSAYHQRHMMFDQRQQRDYRAKNRNINAEDQRVAVQKHENELKFRSQDAKINDEEKAYADAHGGHVSKEELARLDQRREADKERQLNHAHHDDYRAQLYALRATNHYTDAKQHIHYEEKK